MVEDDGQNPAVDNSLSTEEWLSRAQALVPKALEKAKQVKGFPGRWKMIVSKLEQIPSRLSDLSSHPCFSKNPLCKEQLQAVSKTLNETIELAEFCVQEKYEGKLRMQSNLDSLAGKLDLNLRDCGLLIKTGVLGEVSFPSSSEPESTNHGNLRELLARLQIGHLEAKHKVLDSLVHVLRLGSLGAQQASASAICRICGSAEMERALGEAGCVPFLVAMLEAKSNGVREVTAQAIARLMTVEHNFALFILDLN